MPVILPAVRQVSVENRADSSERVGVTRKSSKTLEVPGVPQVEVSSITRQVSVENRADSSERVGVTRKSSKTLEVPGVPQVEVSSITRQVSVENRADSSERVGVTRKSSKTLEVPGVPQVEVSSITRQVSVENRADSSERVGVTRKSSKTLEVPGVPQVEVSSIKSDGALTQSRPSGKGSKDRQILQTMCSGSSETGLLETARSCDRSETAFSQTARRWQGSRKGSKDLQVPQGRRVSTARLARRQRGAGPAVSAVKLPSRRQRGTGQAAGQAAVIYHAWLAEWAATAVRAA
ncbi:unnamed protein product [Polarella glacialis]|uniref:Uncharacterized protein n=1 Tax=Polarella glacialis TaxID=89957 RepID=A0A813K0Y8_POLGL|nr:unnamed protein product [Polarella glacialis]